MEEDESTKIILEYSRFWVQKVFVPVMVCVATIGNTMTVMVLTRRRMRNSTNTYLSALAIADIIHLLFVFFLSFRHYDHIHDSKYELYWRLHGITLWLCDAASSTSVWLTVSFTIERYIAVCHPMKGRALCTETRAKTVIVVVCIFCIATTAGTIFEYQISSKNVCDCKQFDNHTTNHQKTISADQELVDNNTDHPPDVVYAVHADSMAHIMGVLEDRLSWKQTPLNKTNEERSEVTNRTCCEEYSVSVENTDLGNNYTYSTFVSWYSALFFGLFPLAMIATFNCFLVRAVYLSQKKRKVMTKSQENMSVSNENRITLMLIAVVVMFLICQTPTAVFLIYNNLNTNEDSARKRNINLILGNFFNLLIMLNGSFNFVLYSVMSKRFRSTFQQIFCNRGMQRHDTMLLSSVKSLNSQKFSPNNKQLMRRNVSEYRTSKSSETEGLMGVPRSKSLMVRATNNFN